MSQNGKKYCCSLYYDIAPEQWPIVYDDRYNISFAGLEKLHVFDATKWRNIVQFLKDDGLVSDETLVRPREANKEDLLMVHTKRYLRSLKWSFNVACIAEIPPLAFVPNVLIQRGYLKPMRLQTGGTILAGKLAVERGWAINVGGGFHHCSASKGGGFCPYADIQLLVRYLQRDGLVGTAMIVDLDAHQGNGYERDFLDCSEVFIFDMYNASIYPRDRAARRAINRRVELSCYTADFEYLTKLKKNLTSSLKDFHPDIIVYNAGTDILEGDPLGLLSISEKGIIQRDEFVFRTCRELHIPVVMLTSGGYLKRTAKIIADSVLNLFNLGIISLK